MSEVTLTPRLIECVKEGADDPNADPAIPITPELLSALCNMALAYLETQKWSEWKGEGPAPASWYAINPQTGERTKVYRSYEDYVDD